MRSQHRAMKGCLRASVGGGGTHSSGKTDIAAERRTGGLGAHPGDTMIHRFAIVVGILFLFAAFTSLPQLPAVSTYDGGRYPNPHLIESRSWPGTQQQTFTAPLGTRTTRFLITDIAEGTGQVLQLTNVTKGVLLYQSPGTVNAYRAYAFRSGIPISSGDVLQTSGTSITISGFWF